MMVSYLGAMTLMLVYSARFVSELAVPKEWLPFRTFEEFLQDGTYQLGAMPDTAHSAYFQVLHYTSFGHSFTTFFKKKFFSSNKQKDLLHLHTEFILSKAIKAVTLHSLCLRLFIVLFYSS
jgi:hypothetical protein